MQIKKVNLKNFRRYDDSSFEFSSGINLICGPNAKGKTTILEALHYLMIGRSFRTGQSQELIRRDESCFYLESLFVKHGIDQSLRIFAENKSRKIIHNSTSITSLSNLLGIVKGVVQTPDDVNLIKGAPSSRRKFLDFQIAQLDPLYVRHLARYSRAMQQRNLLLRTKQIEAIEAWEHEMAKSAAYIVLQRQKTVTMLQSLCQSYYTALTGEKTPILLHYRTHSQTLSKSDEIKNYYTLQYEKHREKEKILGYTLSGPHKDDMTILIQESEAKHYASEGQQRSCTTALHLAEWQCMRDKSGEPPVFMIDDVAISLDRDRRERLIEQLANIDQVFLTTTDSHLLNHFTGNKTILDLSHGAK